ncbi:vascular endothelial growth factor-like protein [Variola virus]|uniref:Vascular endothelial growth factor-like protein n=1 Tax=Variola virus TaxID=10255 RepID=Q0NJY6_VARV|nr:vascular endothelial growth factor-like protein [Variola virus]ABF23937.1 vascular endothelial growth factor-like protein [Variola virus]ABF24134.1 vascular endothelial growth factor-like protein [Variola virus]ABG43536.1 vascular endothelial growth factor-like protein [Variola virus]
MSTILEEYFMYRGGGVADDEYIYCIGDQDSLLISSIDRWKPSKPY